MQDFIFGADRVVAQKIADLFYRLEDRSASGPSSIDGRCSNLEHVFQVSIFRPYQRISARAGRTDAPRCETVHCTSRQCR
jgi:hypothetical protein